DSKSRTTFSLSAIHAPPKRTRIRRRNGSTYNSLFGSGSGTRNRPTAPGERGPCCQDRPTDLLQFSESDAALAVPDTQQKKCQVPFEVTYRTYDDEWPSDVPSTRSHLFDTWSRPAAAGRIDSIARRLGHFAKKRAQAPSWPCMCSMNGGGTPCVMRPRSSSSLSRSPSLAADRRRLPGRQVWRGSRAERSGWGAKAAACSTRCRRTVSRSTDSGWTERQ